MNRIIPGLLIAIAWLLLLFIGESILFSVVLVVVSMIAAIEYNKMVFPKQDKKLTFYLAVTMILPVIAAAIIPQYDFVALSIFCSLLLVSFFLLIQYSKIDNSFLFLCRLVFGVIYIGFLCAHLVLIFSIPQGPMWLLFLSLITAGSDSGAYYTGRAFGKHKLCEAVSPNKTREGAVGGLIVALIISSVFAYYRLPDISWYAAILFCTVLTAIGICGDLVESVIKRSTGTKDSGNILGGHGGVLDRIDSILFASPLLYILLTFVVYR